MRAVRDTMLQIALATALAVGCGSPSGSDPIDQTAGCVTDHSCEFNEECNGGGCTPISPALRSHIQLASCLLRPPLDAAEVTWRASHFDLLIAGFLPNEVRAVNPNLRLFEYVIARYNRFDRPVWPKTAALWASQHGYNGEDFYLHYREDTVVPTWEGKTIVTGYPAGMVPGWNPGGGGNPATATSRDQSRVVAYYSGGEPWYLANVAHPGYRQFLNYVVGGLIDGTWWYDSNFTGGPIDGVMVDESIWYPLFGEGQLNRSNEYYGIPINDTHPYTYAIENMYPGLASGMFNEFSEAKDIMPNYGHVLFLSYPNRCSENIQKTTPWIYGEVWVTHTGSSTPVTGGNRCISENYDYDQGVRQIIKQTRAGGRRVLGARDLSSGSVGTDRGKMLSLGLYYLIHNKHTYYTYETVITHAGAGHMTTWAWNPAVEYDIGQPDVIPNGAVDFESKSNTREHYVFATGTDPYNNSLTYRVYGRRFTNGLVLVKLLPVGSTVDDFSITTHALDGTYVPLLADGNVGAPITQASIRNNEALVLIRVP